jgi:hypothetical protein
MREHRYSRGYGPPKEKGKKKIRKLLDDADISGSTGTLAVSRSRRVAIRREQWERSENEHREKEKNNLKEDVESTAP